MSTTTSVKSKQKTKGKTTTGKSRKRKESKTSARKTKALQNQIAALQLRVGGATYQAIADALGYAGASGAAKAVYRALENVQEELRETTLQYVQLQLERLDRMLLAVWPAASRGSYGAVDRVLRIEERRAKLLGLDIAKETLSLEHSGEVSVTFNVIYGDPDAPNERPTANPPLLPAPDPQQQS